MRILFCTELLGLMNKRGERTTMYPSRQIESGLRKGFGGCGVISPHFLPQESRCISLNRVGLGFSGSRMQ